ncbi:MAG: pyruvate, water dikinase [Parcubacteria bacterium C7867-004]|nr:MAG: pyruvate, water dikinase [Parcubacteria bacterium C7867-004]
MELIREFGRIGRNDAPIAGGKGASLGEMTQAGIPVPPGYVILADTFERFIEETHLNVEIDAILATVSHEEMHTVEHASEMIQGLILQAAMPEDIKIEVMAAFKKLDTEFVAVRSSATAEDGATAAWAGQLDTYLNTTEATVLEKVQECWASLFTPRAIFYRFEKGLDTQKISVAVVVQKMVNSDAAGIAFSVHPVTEDRNQLIIEAGFGLGEAVVSGQITPDSYVITKEPREIIDKNLADQERGLFRKEGGGNEWRDTPKGTDQVLSDEQILALSETVIGIEKHYGFPCDIEWAMEGSDIYITQSRPITTLSEDFNSAAPTEIHTDRFPDPSLYTKFGRWVAPTIEMELWLDWSRSPEAAVLGVTSDPNPGVLSFDGHYFVRTDGAYARITDKVRSEFEAGSTTYADSILAIANELSEECVHRAGEAGSHDSIEQFEKDYNLMRRLRFPWWSCFSIGAAADGMIGEYAKAHNLAADDIGAALPQFPSSVTRDQDALTDFRKELEEKKLPFDMDAIQQQDAGLASRLAEYQQNTEYLGTHHFWGDSRSMPAFMEALSKAEPSHEATASDPYPELSHVLAAAGRGAQVRLECAQSCARLAYAWRSFLTRLAQGVGLSYEEVIFLSFSEIRELATTGSIPASDLKERVKKVGIYKDENDNLTILSGEKLDACLQVFLSEEQHEGVTEVTGSSANRGKAQGIAVVVLTPQDAKKVEQGMILFAPETTPDFIPAMGKAAAFVTDLGGITSHAAIVSREMKKPCIIGTKIGTQVFKDGDLVEVDADAGIVRILKSFTEQEVVLSKVFSREKPLFYFQLWNDSDRLGFKDFYAHELAHAVFVVPAGHGKGAVWYDAKDWEELSAIRKRTLAEDPTLMVRLKERLDMHWPALMPYLSEEKTIESGEDLEDYYEHLVRWWSGMSAAFEIPDDPDAPQEAKDLILSYRAVSEKYTEQMSKLMTGFWKQRFPDLAELAPYVTPDEAVALARAGDESILARIKDRAEGCVMIDENVYPLRDLESELARHGLVFEELASESVTETQGATAYKGKASGIVRKVSTFADMNAFQKGEILVTEMTNPDYVAIMKIAGAVVTDEGGMTCHAAIASRELKVPCIVGTKNATQVLKDGDMVEVDADTGTVRIIA